MRVFLRSPLGTSALAFAALVGWLSIMPACVDESGRETSFPNQRASHPNATAPFP